MTAIMGRNRADHNEPRDVHRDVARGRIPRTRAERLAERDRLITAHRYMYGKGGLWDKGSKTLKEIPIIGETALKPMKTFLDTTTDLYAATHDKQGHSHYTKAIKDFFNL